MLDPSLRDTYIRDVGRSRQDFEWTEKPKNEDYFREDFFTRFSGQGRVRWHCGVAPSILAGIEKTPITRYGRGWLADSYKARTILVKGPEKLYGLHWFDRRSVWQIMASVALVGASFLGAFTISYFTPTVGLGCRSGGYVIYLSLAVMNIIIEGLCWALVREESMGDRDPLARFGLNLDRRLFSSSSHWKTIAHTIVHSTQQWWQHFTARDKIEKLILQPLDIFNSLWLSYIVISQVFGFYHTCDCQCSMWTSIGGYMDFETFDFYRGAGVSDYWGASTALSFITLMLAFAYAIIEWGQQSHLSTEDYQSAQRGLRTTRKFRRFTEGFHKQRHCLEQMLVNSLSPLTRLWSHNKRDPPISRRKQMVWSSTTGKLAIPAFSLPRATTLAIEAGTAISYEATNSRSHSSQSIDRRPLLCFNNSASLSHRHSLSSSLGDQDCGGIMRRAGSSDSDAVFDGDVDLSAFQQSHIRPPRMSYGEHDLHPPAPVSRSSPRISSGEEKMRSPKSTSRSQP